MYTIIFRSRFEKEFAKIDKKNQKRIVNTLEELSKDPFHHPQVRRIAGVKQLAFRVRIGRWRVLYFVVKKDKTIEILDVFLRKGAGDYKSRL